MEIYWETPYYTLPPNSLPNLTEWIFRLIVPGEQCAKHLKSEEKDVAETEAFVVRLAQASPSLTVFDLHSDDECLTEKAFRTIILSCVKLEKIRFHITRDRFYYNGLRKAVDQNFVSLDRYATAMQRLCNGYATTLQQSDKTSTSMSRFKRLETICRKCGALTALHCNGQLFLKSSEGPSSEILIFFGMLEKEAFGLPARSKLYHQNVHLIFLQVNVKLFSRNEKCRFLL
jgi:hypothetical protein